MTFYDFAILALVFIDILLLALIIFVYIDVLKPPKVETGNISKKKNRKVFAIWYTKGSFEAVAQQITQISIGFEYCDVDPEDFQGDEDENWKQGDGFFPEEGIVTLQQISIQDDPAPRWKITMECDDCGTLETWGPDRYSLSPYPILNSWDHTFTKYMNGEAAEWGIK